MGRRRVCPTPSERYTLLVCILTKSARLRTEISYNAGSVRQVSQTSQMPQKWHHRLSNSNGNRKGQTMKNKDDPSSGMSRGNHRTPGDPSLPDSASMRTTGSTVRADDIASASLEKLAFSVLPMSLAEALAEQGVETQELMGRSCSSSSNRPVRTRMPWWCGEGALKRGILTRFMTFVGIKTNKSIIRTGCRMYQGMVVTTTKVQQPPPSACVSVSLHRMYAHSIP